MERDKFMSPHEAKDFGLIDKVLIRPSKDKDTKNEDSTEKAADNVEKPEEITPS